MSLGVVIKGTEGIVLAAESRVTLTLTMPNGQSHNTNFDNATKLLSFGKPNLSVGAVTYGNAAIGLRTAASFVSEFEATLPENELTIDEFTNKLSAFFKAQWDKDMPDDYKGQPMVFIVAGYEDNEAYGRVFSFELPKRPNPVEINPGQQFGISWGGQREIVDRILQGFDSDLIKIIKENNTLTEQQKKDIMDKLSRLQISIPYQFLPLQDCVNLAIFVIRTTIEAQQLSTGLRGCGGFIDVATITKNGKLEFVQRKRIVGENDFER